MGVADIKAKAYFANRYYFADACNATVFDGRQVIDPKSLERLPTSSINMYGTGEMYRDVLGKAQVMTDGKMAYAIFGIENMKEFDYAFPVRDGCYYFNTMYDQVREARSANRARWKEERPEGITAGEWMYGFCRDGKLMPVVNITYVWGDGDWDGPMSLFEMVGTDDPEILSKMNDYKLKNMVIPARMTEEDFGKYVTDTGKILRLAKASGSMQEMWDVVHREGFDTVDPEAADYISAVLNMELNTVIREGRADMCKAMEELRSYERGEGRSQGLIEGKNLGLIEGKAQGLKEGRNQGRRQGRSQERKQGITKMFLALRSVGISDAAAVEKTAAVYEISTKKVIKTLSEMKVA